VAGLVRGELEELPDPPNDLVLMFGFGFAVWPLSSPIASSYFVAKYFAE